MNRVSRLIWLTALALTASALAGRAADLEWQVEAGFGQQYTAGEWTPLRVTLQNNGDSRSGRIVIPVRSDEYSQPVIYSVPIDLPKGARKSYRLILPTLDYRQRIKVEAGGEALVQEVPNIAPVSPEDVLMVVLSGGEGALGFLKGTTAPLTGAVSAGPGGPPQTSGGAEFAVAQSNWGTLPESWLGWDGVDVVVLAAGDLGAADPKEIEALKLWVRLGGTLVVTGGARAASIADGAFGELLPMDVRGTRTVPSLVALEQWGEEPLPRQAALIADGTLREGAEVLLGTTAEPLIVRSRADAGSVVMTTFDLTAEPVKYWDGQEALWRQLVGAGLSARTGESNVLGAASGASWAPPGYGAGAGIASAAGRTQEASLPPLWLVTGFLAAYIVILVPLNYWFVNRLRRRELAWLTTPAIVLVFFGAAYGTGFVLRGHQTLLNRVAAVEVDAGQQLARARGFAGIFSPAKTDYTLLLKGSAAAALSTDWGSGDGFTVEFGPEPKVKDISLNMWSTRVVEVPFVAELGDGLSGFIEWDGSDLYATVRNNTGLPLESVGIVREGRIGRTVSLASGQETQVDMRLATELGAGDARDATMGERALVALFRDDPYGYGYPRTTATAQSRAWVVAVATKPMMPVELAGTSARTDDATVILARLPVRLRPGASIHVPEWLVTSRIVTTTGTVREGAYDYYKMPSTSVSQGSITWAFTVPTGKFSDTGTFGLSIPIDRSGTTAAALAPHGSPVANTEVLNVKTGQWDHVPGGLQGTISDPAAHIAEDGTITVRVRVPSGELSLLSPTLRGTVEVKSDSGGGQSE